MLSHEEIQNVSLVRDNDGDVFWENRISDKGEKFMFYFTNVLQNMFQCVQILMPLFRLPERRTYGAEEVKGEVQVCKGVQKAEP